MPNGTGGTGKTTFLNVMKGILGDYAKTADAEMFMAKRGDSGQPFDLAGMEGVRALLAAETEDNKKLAVAKVKRMTGQDPIRACFKHRDSYEFVPSWKIWLATNDLPRAAAGDEAFWDRVRPVPFNVKFRGTENEVKNLADKLLAEEASGILNWAVEGYRQWKEVGLKAPDLVKQATDRWRESEDWLARFLEEHAEPTTSPHEFAKKADVFERFKRWSDSNHEGRGVSDKVFSQEMRKKGYDDAKQVWRDGKAVRVWHGLRLVDTMAKRASQISDMGEVV